jgi:hypothetical protein
MLIRLVPAVLLSAAILLPQTDTASINGFVTDPSGAAVAGVAISATHTGTNARLDTVTNESGFFLLNPLRPGTYAVTAEIKGFKKETLTGITLQVQQRAKIDFSLQVGDVNEQITVEGRAPLLASEETSLGQVIDNRSIVELPLNGRNYLQLGVLAAGVMPALKGRNNDHSAAFIANGLRYTMNNYLLDGVDNNSQITNQQSGGSEITRPSVDAIQEFKMQTSNFSAEFGRSAGAVINVTIKGGTNQIHGTAYEFLRNASLDAKNFFDRPDLPIPPFKQNQFGATIGGPVIRDKTFYFFSWEGTRQRKGLTQVSNLPTIAQRAGNFGTRQIYDPATVRPNPDGAGVIRSPFPNNTIPANRLDPVAARVIALYPQPTNAGAVNNFVFNPDQSDTGDQYDMRADHRFSPKNSFYARFSFLDRKFVAPGPLPEPAVGSTSDRISDQLFTSRNLAAVYTRLLSPTVVNEFRFGWNRVRADLFPFIEDRLSEQLGVRGVSSNPRVTGLASFQPTGFAALGDSPFIPNFQSSQTIQFLDALSMVRGGHSFKIGADIRIPDSIFETYQRERGLFNFNGVFSQDPLRRAATGSAMADFVLGLANDGIRSNPIIGTLRHQAYQFYVQDDWKVTSKLTLNIGLRWELISPFYELNDKQGNFILEPGDPAYGTVVSAGERGRDALGRGFYKFDKNNLSPRFGMAYQITPRTVIRSAFGIFYTTNELWGVVNRMLANLPFHVNSTFPTDQVTPNLIVRDGFPADALSRAPRAPAVISFNPEFPSGYTAQRNFNIQHQLPGGVLVELAYVGSNSVKLALQRDANQPVPGSGPLNPRRLFPNLGSVQRAEPMGTSNYNSLQVRVEKRYSNGLAFLTSYTFGKGLENATQVAAGPFPRFQNHRDLSKERARTPNDSRHRLVYSFTWDLPLGKQKKWAGSGWSAAVLGDWQLTGVWALQSGLPFSVGVGFDPANTGLGGQDARPDRIAHGALPSGQRSINRWFDVSAFQTQAPFTFGNAGRAILDGPGFVNLDFGLDRRFRLTERFSLQLRSEYFNLTNTPQFDQPGGGTIVTAGRPLLNRADAAIISRTIHDARQIQFGLKLIW